MPRQNISSGTRWENYAAYSRAVRIGNWISVSGTTAADALSHPVGVGDPYRQTKYILGKIATALKPLGASLRDVIRTRIYITDVGHWESVARAHGEVFQEIRPANTLIVVQGLIGAKALVEIEADAYIEESI